MPGYSCVKYNFLLAQKYTLTVLLHPRHHIMLVSILDLCMVILNVFLFKLVEHRYWSDETCFISSGIVKLTYLLQFVHKLVHATDD